MNDTRHNSFQNPPISEADGIDSPPPDVVELLKKRGILEAKDIEFAIYYQNKQAALGHNQSLEQVLVRLGLVDRFTLDQMQLEAIHANQALANEVSFPIEEQVRARTHQIEKQLTLLQTAVDINQQVQKSTTLNELIREAVKLVVQYFEIDFAAIFLLDDTSQTLRLCHSNSLIEGAITPTNLEIKTDSLSSVGWVGKYHQVSVTDNVKSAPGAPYLLKFTRSEACLPISADDKFIGVIEVQSSKENRFNQETIEALQIISNFLGPLIFQRRSQEAAKDILGELSMLYQASQGFSHAQTRELVIKYCYKTLCQLPHTIYLLCVEGHSLQPFNSPDIPHNEEHVARLQPFTQLSLSTYSEQLTSQEYLLFNENVNSPGMPHELLNAVQGLGYRSTALIPIKCNHKLAALLILCSNETSQIDQNSLQLYQSLSNMASASLDKVWSQSVIERQLNRLQILENVNQVISVEIDLDKLFRSIHQQVTDVMGDVNFIIALYDQESNTIEIPYAYEENQLISIPSFALGEGLTSIIIRTRQPLLLVEDTEKRAEQLGAKVHGSPAKSWLGVPLLVSGDVIGALIVQDLEKEFRFDIDDQQLLSMLAPQVAIALRNARLIFESTLRAERESVATEITKNLWSASDVNTLLRTALGGLGRALNADTGLVQLEINDGG